MAISTAFNLCARSALGSVAGQLFANTSLFASCGKLKLPSLVAAVTYTIFLEIGKKAIVDKQVKSKAWKQEGIAQLFAAAATIYVAPILIRKFMHRKTSFDQSFRFVAGSFAVHLIPTLIKAYQSHSSE